jgi:hypothetical protein
LHRPSAEQFPDRAHPVQQDLVDHLQWLVPFQGSVDPRLEVLLDAVDDVLLERVFDAQALERIGRRVRCLDALEEGHEGDQRVVAWLAPHTPPPIRLKHTTRVASDRLSV